MWSAGSAAPPPVPPTQLLFIIARIHRPALTCALALTIRPGPNKPLAAGDTEVVPVGQIVRIPGLVAVVLAGRDPGVRSDIIVIYVPLLGAERNIDVHAIGLLLTVRAAVLHGGAAVLCAHGRDVRPLAADDRLDLRLCGELCRVRRRRCRMWAMHVAIAVDGLLVRTCDQRSASPSSST
jgi:hypothetical protein